MQTKSDSILPNGPYVGIQKSPDVWVRVALAALPGLATESDWNADIKYFHNYMREWLVGGSESNVPQHHFSF